MWPWGAAPLVPPSPHPGTSFGKEPTWGGVVGWDGGWDPPAPRIGGFREVPGERAGGSAVDREGSPLTEPLLPLIWGHQIGVEGPGSWWVQAHPCCGFCWGGSIPPGCHHGGSWPWGTAPSAPAPVNWPLQVAFAGDSLVAPKSPLFAFTSGAGDFPHGGGSAHGGTAATALGRGPEGHTMPRATPPEGHCSPRAVPSCSHGQKGSGGGTVFLWEHWGRGCLCPPDGHEALKGFCLGAGQAAGPGTPASPPNSPGGTLKITQLGLPVGG